MTAETFRTLFIIVCGVYIVVGLTTTIVIPVVRAILAEPMILVALAVAVLLGFVAFLGVPT